ncbi:MAG: helix-turn-helix transcriptional regulator [Caldilineaceae bacterium]
MALKHALLALLADEPSYGYELNRRFEDALGPLWPLREAQVYNNLRALEDAGLVVLEARVEQENSPDRKRYAVTEAGREELQSWLLAPVRSSRKLKDDFYLKLSILGGVLRRPEHLIELLWRQREVTLQQLRELEQALIEAESGEDDVTAALLEGAILHTEADLTWLDRCEERLLQEGAP